MGAARGKNSRPERRPVIRLFQAIDVCYARIYHRLEVRSPCKLPREGAGILVSNHTSGLDPLLIQSVCPRLIRWLIAREYYELPALRWIFRRIDAIPVERGSRDISSTRAALRALASGAVLGVFPEGRIERSRQLLPFQSGVALMALKTRVPVYPVYLDGTQRACAGDMVRPFALPQTATLAFGDPIRLENPGNGTGVEDANLRIWESVRALQISYDQGEFRQQKTQKRC